MKIPCVVFQKTIPKITHCVWCVLLENQRWTLQAMCVDAVSWDRPTGRQEPFDFSHWTAAIHFSAQTKVRKFGTPVTLEEALDAVFLSLTDPLQLPKTNPNNAVGQELYMVNETLAVPSVQGWKFRAGETLKDRLHVWKACGVPKKACDIISYGWKGCHVAPIEPAWFHPYALSPQEQVAWRAEHTALWQAGVVTQLSADWIARFGLPVVMLPYFLVDEGTKDRVISDARYANMAQQPPWFPLPTVMDLVHQLSRAELWCKQDMKAGWHHVPYHPMQQALFGYLHEGMVWIYQAGELGDASLPYMYTWSRYR